MSTGNREVAETLRMISEILEIRGENAFKVRAYSLASRAVEGLSQGIRKIADEGALTDIPGIGESIAAKIEELLKTGRMSFFEEIRKDCPPGILDLLRIPSVGPRKAKILCEKLGIRSIEELRAACMENRLEALPGFGPRTQQKILEGIEFRAGHQGEFLLSAALPLARDLLRSMEGCGDVLRASIAGSVRRWKETVRDIDLLASSKKPGRVMDFFVRLGRVSEVLARGETKSSVRLANGIQVDLRVISDEDFPFALAYFTGSRDHNVALRSIAKRKGLKVSEYGIFRGSRRIPCRDEVEFYAALGLPYIPPEIRENMGELSVDSAPELVRLSDLKGILHTHSTWSDGTASIEKMAEKARSMGLRYMGLSDHSRAAGYAGGLDEARLRKQMDEIDEINAKSKDFRVLKGLECDILLDGRLDLSPAILRKLDFVIGSIHSHFSLPEREMTDRVCRAIADDNLDILGHPTGRLLLGRPGYRINLDRVIEAARRHGKILELNAHPNRLDLDWVHCRRAAGRGVLISINPDAHSTAGLDDLEFGIGTARKAWLEKKDVLTTRHWDEARNLFGRRPVRTNVRTG